MEAAEVASGVEKAKKERAKIASQQKEVSVPEELSRLRKAVEDAKRKGKNTSNQEIKAKAIADRVKAYKGKISAKDAEGLAREIAAIKAEIEKL
jgi:hypothetical protein